MFWNKKKDMVDLRDLPRKSSNLPHGINFVPKDGCGFVDLTKKRMLPSELRKMKGMQMDSASASSESSSTFSFFDTPSPASTPNVAPSSSSETEGLLRKISMQVSDLDTKLYKMEQRIELLERKAGVTDSSSSSGFNW